MDSSHCFHTSRLPVCDGLELHGRVLDHRIGASDVDQALVIGAYPGVGAAVLDVAGQQKQSAVHLLLGDKVEAVRLSESAGGGGVRGGTEPAL